MLSFADDDVGDGACQRSIGARVNGEPFVGVTRGRFTKAVVDEYHGNSGFAGFRHFVDLAHAAHARLAAAAAEEHAAICVFDGRCVASQAASAVEVYGVKPEKIVCSLGNLTVRFRIVGAQIATCQIHKTLNGVVARAGCAIVKGLGAVRVKGVLPFFCDDVESLVPADALEFAAAALADALHGVLKALRAVYPLANRTGFQARPERDAAEFRVPIVIVAGPAKCSVHNVAFNGTGRESAVAAALPDDLTLLGNFIRHDSVFRFGGVFLTCFFRHASVQARYAACGNCGEGCDGRSPHKVAPRDFHFVTLAHRPPFFSLFLFSGKASSGCAFLVKEVSAVCGKKSETQTW